MQNGLMFGGLSLVFIVLLIIVRKYHKRELDQIRKNYASEQKFYQQTWADNETLRSYMDEDHVVYNPGMREHFNKAPANKELIVLIRADDLYDLSQRQWRDGHDMAASKLGKTMQMRYGIDNQEEEEGVARIRASFADKKFDNDFAKLVNACTSIAINYGQTQQLRDRLSQQIISFRMYLSKKQRGERVEFPKT